MLSRAPRPKVTIVATVVFYCLSSPVAGELRRLQYEPEDLPRVAAEGLSLCATDSSYSRLAAAFAAADDYQRYFLALALGRTNDERAARVLAGELKDLHEPFVRRPKAPTNLVTPIKLGDAYAAAMDHLGVDWEKGVLEEIRQQHPETTDGERFMVFLDRFGVIREVYQRYVESGVASEKLGRTFLDETVNAENRKFAGELALKLYCGGMTSYGRSYLETLGGRPFVWEPQLRKTSRGLADVAFRFLLMSPTRSELAILRECRKESAWRDQMATKPFFQALVASGDQQAFRTALDGMLRLDDRQAYELTIDWLPHIKEEFADTLLDELRKTTASERQRDVLIMLLAQSGDPRVTPFIAARIGKPGASPIARAVTMAPSPTFVEPLIEARQQNWLKTTEPSDGLYPLLPCLMALKDRRAIPLILESLLSGRMRRSLGGRGGNDLRTPGALLGYLQVLRDPLAAYGGVSKPSATKKPACVEAHYLVQLDARETIPELKGQIANYLSEQSTPSDQPNARMYPIMRALVAFDVPEALEFAEKIYPYMPHHMRDILSLIESDECAATLRRLCRRPSDWRTAVLLSERGDLSGVEAVLEAGMANDADLAAVRESLVGLLNYVEDEEIRGRIIGRIRQIPLAEVWPFIGLISTFSRTRCPELVPRLVAAYRDCDEIGMIRKSDVLHARILLLRAIGRSGGDEAERFLLDVLESRS